MYAKVKRARGPRNEARCIAYVVRAFLGHSPPSPSLVNIFWNQYHVTAFIYQYGHINVPMAIKEVIKCFTVIIAILDMLVQ